MGTSPPSVVGIIQLILLILIIPALAYLYKQLTAVTTLLATLVERMSNAKSDIDQMKNYMLQDIQDDLREIKRRGSRIPHEQRDNT